MPTNVPPQYREAESRFRDATTTQAKIAALQEMLSIMPKHKGTDHLKAQLRSRLSKLMADLDGGASKGPASGRTEPFSMPKEGGGRATLIGPTNTGKSLMLNKSTGARSKVGAYALSTQEPVPGMLNYEDVKIQLVDTPPISNPSTQGRLYGLLRNTDVFVVVVDLAMDAVAQADEVFTALGEWNFTMLGRDEMRESRNPWLDKPTILVGNKADIPGALDQYLELEDAYGDRYSVVMASAEEEVGFDELAEEVFAALGSHPRLYQVAPRESRRLRPDGAASIAHRSDGDRGGYAPAQRLGARLEIRGAVGQFGQVRRPARGTRPPTERQGYYRAAYLASQALDRNFRSIVACQIHTLDRSGSRWLPDQGSNPGLRSQSPPCYHYTTGQRSQGERRGRRGADASDARLRLVVAPLGGRLGGIGGVYQPHVHAGLVEVD